MTVSHEKLPMDIPDDLSHSLQVIAWYNTSTVFNQSMSYRYYCQKLNAIVKVHRIEGQKPNNTRHTNNTNTDPFCDAIVQIVRMHNTRQRDGLTAFFNFNLRITTIENNSSLFYK